ncbi:2-phosphosulfolactate phosphatase [Planctomicrobium sp. SH664]|uniref:2-phosphosulfolactate phosphatase n=1 Tax=Planctomicrobium sp. SH664 TaxID=3448125 RepID=UPI003F5B9E3A
MPHIHVHLLPALLESHQLRDGVVVVADILRATTTIIHALSAGAEAVIPCLTVDEARAAARELPHESRILGGERKGERIDGFDLGNSPEDYTSAVVAGRRVIFTTTNGTKALLECREARKVFIGGFVNLTAVVERLRQIGADAHVLCAGTDGQLTAEDILFAGAVASQLVTGSPSGWNYGNVQGQMAADYYVARSRDPQVFRDTFFASLGARNLLELGMTADIERCLQRDLFPFVPQWNAATGDIRLNP